MNPTEATETTETTEAGAKTAGQWLAELLAERPRYFQTLYRAVYRDWTDEDEDDFAQAVALRVLEHFDQFDPARGTFRRFVWWQARAVAGFQAQQRRIRKRLRPKVRAAAQAVQAERETSVVGEVARRERAEFLAGPVRAVLARHLADMSETRRAIVRARLLDPVPVGYMELARTLGVARPTVCTNVTRAKIEFSKCDELRELAAQLLTL